jgi:hypothetical protein
VSGDVSILDGWRIKSSWSGTRLPSDIPPAFGRISGISHSFRPQRLAEGDRFGGAVPGGIAPGAGITDPRANIRRSARSKAMAEDPTRTTARQRFWQAISTFFRIVRHIRARSGCWRLPQKCDLVLEPERTCPDTWCDCRFASGDGFILDGLDAILRTEGFELTLLHSNAGR